PRHGQNGLRRGSLAALAPPLPDDLFGIEPEIQRVVAQEALRVEVAGQLAVLAPLQGRQVAGANLRVALGAVEVDALALARRVEPLGEAQAGASRGSSGRLAIPLPSRAFARGQGVPP